MKRKLFGFALGLVLLLLIGLSLVYAQSFAANPKDELKELVYYVHWTKHFESLPAMAADSDVIVVGTIVQQAPPRFIADGSSPEAQARIEKEGGVAGVVFTDYDLQVSEVLKGKVNVGDRLTVVQTGGIYKGLKIYVSEDPLFELNEAVILFLEDISGDEIQAPNVQKYMVNSAPQARFKVTADKVVSPYAAAGYDALVGPFQGLDKATFIKAIQEALSP